MSQTVKSERRYLSDDEYEFVSRSHHPALHDLADDALAALVLQLRERRDRAAGISHRQRREMRGKSAPAGSRPATDDTGSERKRQILAAALKRANKERQRRRAQAPRATQSEYAARALAMKQAAAARAQRPSSDWTAGEGMQAIPNERAPELTRPMEIGRVSQFVKDAQAKSDAR